MNIEISGGSVFCYLCNKWHGEAEHCPKLPQLYPPKSEEQVRRELAEAIRKIKEAEGD